jgi:hypothetical protein
MRTITPLFPLKAISKHLSITKHHLVHNQWVVVEEGTVIGVHEDLHLKSLSSLLLKVPLHLLLQLCDREDVAEPMLGLLSA